MKVTSSLTALCDGASGKTDHIYQHIVECDLNDKVQVKVTEYGFKMWRDRRFDEFSNRWRNRDMTDQDLVDFKNQFEAELNRHLVDDGWYEFLGHKLHGLFGHCFKEHVGQYEQPYDAIRYVFQVISSEA